MWRIPRKTAPFGALVGLGALALTPAVMAGAATNSVDLKTSYQATIGARSVRETLNEVVDTGGKRVTVSGSGVADAQGNGSFTLKADGQTLDMVLDSGVLYLKLPAGSSSGTALHVTTPWVSLNLTTIAQSKLGQSYAQLVSDGQQGPAQSLAVLQTASTSGVHKVGTTTLFGAPTTEYETTLNLNKVAAASGKPELAPAIEQLETEDHVSSIPLKVWLDKQQRVRRLVEDVDVPSTGGQKAVRAKVSVNITAFGIPVTVTPPSAGQDTDVTAQALSSAQA
jgi:hypothetical protein